MFQISQILENCWMKFSAVHLKVFLIFHPPDRHSHTKTRDSNKLDPGSFSFEAKTKLNGLLVKTNRDKNDEKSNF